MNTHTTLAALLAMAALSAPMVCQAQDPATAYQQIVKLSQNGQAEEAIKLCDKVIAVYGNPTSRVAKQFLHMVPFFYYQKGSIQFSRKDYAAAYETFLKLSSEQTFKDPKLIEASKSIPGQPLGYTPFLTMSQFQMGYCLFQLAVGDEKTPGDPSKFGESISTLESYLDLYNKGKVSSQEKKLKLDGTICFLLMQAYILKDTPDFKKAADYLEKSRSARAPLTDEMAMNGLNSVVKVTTKNPEYIEWCDKVISSNPESFDLGTARMAPYGANMLNYGISSVRIGDTFLREGKLDAAAGAMRSAVAFFGMVPDAVDVVQTMNGYKRLIGKSKTAVPDKALGQTFNPALQNKLGENYANFVKTNMQPEAYSTLYQANMMLMLGASRLAKAGYKLILDRYPDLSTNKDGKVERMKDQNLFQYANLCRATGDEASAEKFEKMVDSSKMGTAGKHSLIINKMARLAREKQWSEVIPAAEAVIRALDEDKSDPNYITAVCTRVAAMYKLNDYKSVVKAGEELLASGVLNSEKLKPKQKVSYETQVLFFVQHSYDVLAAGDPQLLDKSIEVATQFMQKFPSTDLKENPLAPNVYYFCIDALLKRRGHGDAAANVKDMERALRYCDTIEERWPDNKLTPTALLLGGKILAHGEDDDKKPQGLDRLEQSVERALKLGTDNDRNVAAEALYLLASYSGEFDRADRVPGYVKRFWEEADHEGNPFALQMAALDLMRDADGNDKAAFDTSVKRAQEIIAREANYGVANNIFDPELEKTINAYASAYVDGTKKFDNKDLTLEEKTEHFVNFPGIGKDNKYATAILRMAMINSMADAQAKARKDNPELAVKLENDIARTMRQMTGDFKPEDLTNFICVQVGNSTVTYAAKMPDPKAREEQAATAVTYFDMVLSRGTDMQDEASLGKAKALGLSADKAKQTESGELYKKLANSTNPEVAGPALKGVTELYLSTGNYGAAVDAASKYVDNRALARGKDRLNMLMMLGEAYGKSGDTNRALQTYMNLYNQNIGAISYSAPSCKAIMELLWNRNEPASGDRLKGNFKQSDRWRAWSTGQDYLTKIRKNGIDKKMSAQDRDLFLEVEKLVNDYSKDAAVQKEDKEKKAFQSKINK